MDDSYFEMFEDDFKINIPQKFIREEPRTEVKDSFFFDNTRHEAVVPFNSEYTPISREPKCESKEYKFELDTFQKLSISAIERDESVLVSAHTSCGKTVVAEYAIAKSIQNKQRVIYTSPIKALSNQKFRELKEEFQDVGLMTGDVTINPEASCLVMTTEILRNMLYRGSEVIREVRWIIFDEIHYMRDKERGVVWEETIILLPEFIRMVFLSATIPNALEFAEWISFVHSQTVHVVYTNKRVIPLIHYFYTHDLYLIQDQKFHLQELEKCFRKIPEKRDLTRLIPDVLKNANLPAVVFAFSRKDCEKFAIKVQNDYLNEEEQEMVDVIFNNAISSLREEDRNISIIEHILPLLKRGVGIHHSGLLPIIREIVEILFQESLIKVLFATETFSIGLNMPAKTVIFTALRKFDGNERRLLTSGEFIQMSGRAGRRGLDKKGEVISILTEDLTPTQVKNIFAEASDKLFSAFRLTYNMILNLSRVEGLDPLFILSRSFFHYQTYKNALLQESKITEIIECPKTELADLLLKRQQLLSLRNQALSATLGEYLRKGRVIDLMVPKSGYLLTIRNAIIKEIVGDSISVFVLTNKDIENRQYPVVCVSAVYDMKAKIHIKVFTSKFSLVQYNDEIDEKIIQAEDDIHQICDVDLSCCLICKCSSSVCLMDCVLTPSGIKVLDDSVSYLKYLEDHSNLQQQISSLNKLKEIYHMAECKKMVNVLKHLQYIDETSVLIKGKMASEISASDELVITEMIFNTSFPSLPLIDMISLISCFVCEEKDETEISAENDRLYKIIVDVSSKVCDVMNQNGIEVKHENYIKKFSPQLMDVVKMWMAGKTFVEICSNTSAFEGSIIRAFKRLEELLRQLSNAAAVIGNNELVNLFGQGIFLIKRDIIFANSLYI